MNVYQPLRRSLVAIGVTLAIVAGAQAMAQISSADDTYASSLPTISAVSVSPTCVADAHSNARKICYQANVFVGEPTQVDETSGTR